jgi:hypothetical protein
MFCVFIISNFPQICMNAKNLYKISTYGVYTRAVLVQRRA